MGVFAGQVPNGAAYTATKIDTLVAFVPGDSPPPNPPYVSSAVPVVGDASPAYLPKPAYYTATAPGPQPEAVASASAFAITNIPPYQSAVDHFNGMEANGLTGTANPKRHVEISGLPPVTPDAVPVQTVNGAWYSAQTPNN